MGYTTRALGDVASWWGVSTNTSEVYVYRAHVEGVPLQSPLDALMLVRGVGSTSADDLDVRAIALKNTGPDAWDIDVIMTSASSRVWVLAPTADAFTNALTSDADLKQFAPNMKVSNASLLQLTGPADAIDFWHSQPTLWDHTLGTTGKGGPTDTFATPVDYSVVYGQADDGKRSKPWKKSISLAPTQPQDSSSTNYGWLVLAAVALGIVGLEFSKKKKRTS